MTVIKLYDPEAYSLISVLVSAASDVATLTFGLIVTKCTKIYRILKLNPVCTVFLLIDAMTLTYNRILPLSRVIKCIKLYETEASAAVSILPTRPYTIYTVILKVEVKNSQNPEILFFFG
jgi:hypothetical protein